MTPADTGPADGGPAKTAAAGSDPADPALPESGQADSGQAEAGQVETAPPDSSQADSGQAKTGQAEAGQAGAGQAGAGQADTDQAEARTAGTGTAGASTADPGVAVPDRPGRQPRPGPLPQGTPGSHQAAPGAAARVPARQGPPPPGLPARTGGPAVLPGGLPAAQPGTAPATRPGGMPAAPRPGVVPATRPGGRVVPVRRPAPQPSWGTVLATTIRLWARRRLEKPWWRVLLVLVLAAIVFAAGAITITLTRGTGTTGQSGIAPGNAPGGRGSLAAVALARKQAATWVSQQVNPAEVIGCDPLMCAALQAAHINANRLLMLGPGQPDPLGSEILLDTATLRSQFGARLDTLFAPVSLAAFGSGAARVEVRVDAPYGAQAYLAELAADVAARKLAGSQIVRNSAIHASPAARRQLVAGQVDTRLLVTLVTLAHSHPVDIISFGANQAGASPGVPLRSAEIAGAPGPGSTPAASVQTLRTFLTAQQPPYRPSIVAVHTASRRTVLRVGYLAPSLLGLLGPHG